MLTSICVNIYLVSILHEHSPSLGVHVMRQGLKRKAKNRRLLVALLVGAILMFGFGFLLVPLYDVMCDVLGLNGRAELIAAAQQDAGVDVSRTVKVQFIAAKNDTLPIAFYPTDATDIKSLKPSGDVSLDISLHPGENKRLAFYAKNETKHTILMQAIPSVSPGIAAKYVRKTDCFCFEHQQLLPGQAMLMPVIFHLDTALPKRIHTVSMLYTVFDITGKKKALGSAKQAGTLQ